MKDDLLQTVPSNLVRIQTFVNTCYGPERLCAFATTQQVRAWCRTQSYIAEDIEVTESERKRIVDFRETVRALLLANNGIALPPESLADLNHFSKYALLHIRFANEQQADLIAETKDVDGVIAFLLGDIYSAMAKGSWLRLKACRNHKCQKAFYDSSKNHSGIWCDMQLCGNRTKAHLYRQRHPKAAL